jgi:hypothetical protein
LVVDGDAGQSLVEAPIRSASWWNSPLLPVVEELIAPIPCSKVVEESAEHEMVGEALEIG